MVPVLPGTKKDKKDEGRSRFGEGDPEFMIGSVIKV